MAKNARAMITSRYERNKFWKLMLEEYYRQIKIELNNIYANHTVIRRFW